MSKNSGTFVRWLSVVITAVSGVYILGNSWEITSTQFVIVGIVSVFMCIMLAGSAKQSWPAIGSLGVFGFYMIAKGAGYIDFQWIRFVIGPLLVLASFIGFAQLTKIIPDKNKD